MTGVQTCALPILIKYNPIESVSSFLSKYQLDTDILNLVLTDALYAEKNSFDRINILLSAGANPNFIEGYSMYEKKSILYKAIEKGDVTIIECLLRHGANPNLRNEDRERKSCLYEACHYYNCSIKKNINIDREILVRTIIDLLLDYGLNMDESGINIKDAICSFHKNLITHMLNRPFYNNQHGENPFHMIACQIGRAHV